MNDFETGKVSGEHPTEIRCPNCQAVCDAEQLFCKSCGTKLKNICPNCNTVLPPDMKFCSNCGQPLSPAQPAAAAAPYMSPAMPYTPVRPKKNRAVPIIIAACVVAAAAGGFAYYKYYTDIKTNPFYYADNGDYVTALDYVDDDQMVTLMKEVMIISVIDNLFDGEAATISAPITGAMYLQNDGITINLIVAGTAPNEKYYVYTYTDDASIICVFDEDYNFEYKSSYLIDTDIVESLVKLWENPSQRLGQDSVERIQELYSSGKYTNIDIGEITDKLEEIRE